MHPDCDDITHYCYDDTMGLKLRLNTFMKLRMKAFGADQHTQIVMTQHIIVMMTYNGLVSANGNISPCIVTHSWTHTLLHVEGSALH